MSAPDDHRLGDAGRKARVAGLVRQGRRAGRLVVGVELTRQALRDGRAHAVLVAEDLSPNRRDRVVNRCREAAVTISRGWSKEELGDLAGKPAVAVLTVADRNMAAGIEAIESAANPETKDRKREE